jgi:hypothetical protein
MTRTTTCLLATLLCACGDAAPFQGKDRHEPGLGTSTCGALVDHGEDGTTDGVWSYSYDIKGDPAQDRYTAVGDTEPSEWVDYRYDDQRRLLELVWVMSPGGEGTYRETYAYAADGQLVRSTVEIDPDYYEDEHYLYDEAGAPLGYERWSRDGEVLEAWMYRSDGDGRRLVMDRLVPAVPVRRMSYDYQDDGYLVIGTMTESDALVFTQTLTYSRDDGQLLEQVTTVPQDGYTYEARRDALFDEEGTYVGNRSVDVRISGGVETELELHEVGWTMTDAWTMDTWYERGRWYDGGRPVPYGTSMIFQACE